MNGKKARLARQVAEADVVSPPRSRILSWRRWTVGLAGAAIIAGSFVVPDVFDRSQGPSSHSETTTAKLGLGLPIGAQVPAFSERDVRTGAAITSSSIYDRMTLLFFSEGVMCQACLAQIEGIERLGGELEKRRIELVSVTPDSSGDLRLAASEYGLTTPLISDDDRTMSKAFNTLGRGMHGDTPGHAFVLVGQGQVLWYRDYWLPPTRSMYVDAERILRELPRVS